MVRKEHNDDVQSPLEGLEITREWLQEGALSCYRSAESAAELQKELDEVNERIAPLRQA